MTSTTSERYEQIKKIVEQTPKGQLAQALGDFETGYDAVLDTMFEVYQQRFLPERAKDAAATFAFTVDTPAGVLAYALVIADGRCEVVPGSVADATTTVAIGIDHFVRLSMGLANGMVLAMTRKLHVSGNMMAMMNIREWFATP
jgi:putative sterol carrier protein